jgi:hypothetical protein
MKLFLMTLAAFGMAAVAVYAHYRIPQFTEGAGQALLSRAVLIVVGVAFGYLNAAIFASAPFAALLAFVIGFGTVHFPAACILFVKQERGSGKS